jgi:hypothetical protein
MELKGLLDGNLATTRGTPIVAGITDCTNKHRNCYSVQTNNPMEWLGRD